MNKKKSKVKKAFSDPKLQRILLVLLPCITLCLIAGILSPRIMYYVRSTVDPIETAAPSDGIQVIAASSAPVPSVKPSITPFPVPTPPAETPSLGRKVSLNLTSTQRDLYVRVKDENGELVSGEKFSLTFEYPNGERNTFSSDTDGTCYLVDLEPGDYTVTLNAHEGFEAPISEVGTVVAVVEHKQIEDISEIVDVVDSDEISQSEIKITQETGEEKAPEYIDTPTGVDEDSGFMTILTPVYDDKGEQVFDVSFSTGENGYLLLASDGTESDVIPVDEDNNGVPEYGLRWVDEPNGKTKGYYTAVEIFAPDGTPDPRYISISVPKTEAVTAKVGWQEIDGNTYYYNQDSKPVTGLKNIDGKMYYFNQFGVCAKSLGIDVSFYNEGINWHAVKAQGVDFAIIRVGGRGWESGLMYDDTCFRQNLLEAKAAGLNVGVYFYSTAIDSVEAVQEASLVLERLGGTSLDYPVFIDVEWSGEYPNGRADKLGKLQRTEIINAFCETVASAGYRTGVYSGQNFFLYNLELASLSKYTIWLASYTSFNAVPSFSGRYDIWQFTDNGVVNGISGKVDMNAVF